MLAKGQQKFSISLQDKMKKVFHVKMEYWNTTLGQNPRVANKHAAQRLPKFLKTNCSKQNVSLVFSWTINKMLILNRMMVALLVAFSATHKPIFHLSTTKDKMAEGYAETMARRTVFCWQVLVSRLKGNAKRMQDRKRKNSGRKDKS